MVREGERAWYHLTTNRKRLVSPGYQRQARAMGFLPPEEHPMLRQHRGKSVLREYQKELLQSLKDRQSVFNFDIETSPQRYGKAQRIRAFMDTIRSRDGDVAQLAPWKLYGQAG